MVRIHVSRKVIGPDLQRNLSYIDIYPSPANIGIEVYITIHTRKLHQFILQCRDESQTGIPLNRSPPYSHLNLPYQKAPILCCSNRIFVCLTIQNKPCSFCGYKSMFDRDDCAPKCKQFGISCLCPQRHFAPYQPGKCKPRKTLAKL